MHWDAGENAGFTTGTPWIRVNPNYVAINAAEQMGRADSVFNYYKALIGLRKEYPIFVDGRFELLAPEHPQIFAYTRTTEEDQLLVICNFSGNEVSNTIDFEWSDYELLLTNETENKDFSVLKPYEARMYLKKVR